MYCHYCGRPATGRCPACGHRVCPDHQRRWLFLTVCKKCYWSMWVGSATAAALLAAVVGVYIFVTRS
jgi:hypothetical protein